MKRHKENVFLKVFVLVLVIKWAPERAHLGMDFQISETGQDQSLTTALQKPTNISQVSVSVAVLLESC